MSANKIDTALLLYESHMTDPQVFEFLDGQLGVFSTPRKGRTTPNEDAAAVLPWDEDSGVLVVADGVGGHSDGEVAARLAVTAMTRSIQESQQTGGLLRSAIINGFELANEEVRSLATGAGTTLAVVELSSGMARPYHAGDSIILIVGSRGRVKLETTSHSPVGFGLEAGLLDEDEAMEHEDRHVVLNVVGSDSMRIDIGSAVKLAELDTVLLASDGLTDNMMLDDIVNVARKDRLSRSLNQLVQHSRTQMEGADGPSKPDDLTIVMYRPRRPRARAGTTKTPAQ